MDPISEAQVDSDGQLIFVFHPATNLLPMRLDGIKTIFRPDSIKSMAHPENALYFDSPDIPRLKNRQP